MHAPQRARPTLYGRDGRRKYLTQAERARFIAAASAHPRPEVATFCLLLAYTGCRISEALAVRGTDIEQAERFVALFSLKKRNDILVREIPLPGPYVAQLVDTHGEHIQSARRLWRWSRCRAWRIVKTVMLEADIGCGAHQTAKGLRHSFGITAIQRGVPLNMVQRWLGHASIATTAIYTEALGVEERELASRLWRDAAPGTMSSDHFGSVEGWSVSAAFVSWKSPPDHPNHPVRR